MWLEAKDAAHYVIYLAKAKNGACDDVSLRSNVAGTISSNTFKPNEQLIPTTVYCWAVDVVTSSGMTVQGDVIVFINTLYRYLLHSFTVVDLTKNQFLFQKLN